MSKIAWKILQEKEKLRLRPHFRVCRLNFLGSGTDYGQRSTFVSHNSEITRFIFIRDNDDDVVLEKAVKVKVKVNFYHLFDTTIQPLPGHALILQTPTILTHFPIRVKVKVEKVQVKVRES
jgi:hypothetical protein